jgi:hypothetical protein
MTKKDREGKSILLNIGEGTYNHSIQALFVDFLQHEPCRRRSFFLGQTVVNSSQHAPLDTTVTDEHIAECASR